MLDRERLAEVELRLLAPLLAPGPRAVHLQSGSGWTASSSVIGAGLAIEHLGEYSEPFWRPANALAAAAWSGDLPNSFTLIARKT